MKLLYMVLGVSQEEVKHNKTFDLWAANENPEVGGRGEVRNDNKTMP